MRSMDMTTPPGSGTAAPVVPVPRPRTVSETPAAWQALTVACTAAVSAGNTTACGSAWARLLS